MRATVTFYGFKELDKLLTQLPEDLENKVLQQSIRQASKIGVNVVKAMAPQHQEKQSAASKRYGSLFENIRQRDSKIDKKTTGRRSVLISTFRAFWGYFYEVGTDAFKGTRTHRSRGFQFRGVGKNSDELKSLNSEKKTNKGNASFRRTAGVALGNRRQPARPWFTIAIEKSQNAIMSDLAKSIGKNLIKIAVKEQATHERFARGFE